ncbi:hypothetical protein D4759_11680 [Clostridiales bacterium AHG0011]|nr:hypothetical protein [Clostridiales bacterium AHG0011]RGC57088.1 hypothetical protein DW690_21145 [Dorea longicatena]
MTNHTISYPYNILSVQYLIHTISYPSQELPAGMTGFPCRQFFRAYSVFPYPRLMVHDPIGRI